MGLSIDAHLQNVDHVTSHPIVIGAIIADISTSNYCSRYGFSFASTRICEPSNIEIIDCRMVAHS